MIGGFEVAVELHNSPSEEGPGVGVMISGVVGGVPVEGSLCDLFSRGALSITGGAERVRVPEPVIGQIDEWCMQYLI